MMTNTNTIRHVARECERYENVNAIARENVKATIEAGERADRKGRTNEGSENDKRQVERANK